MKFYYLKKILYFRRMSCLSFFIYFNCSPPATTLNHKYFVFYSLLSQKFAGMHPIDMGRYRQGPWATPLHSSDFSEIWALQEICQWEAKQDHACPTCPLKSQPLELHFCVSIIISQGQILLSTPVLSKIKKNLIHQICLQAVSYQGQSCQLFRFSFFVSKDSRTN